MAEFCLKCFNEMVDGNYKRHQVYLEKDFCEGCGKVKKCVVVIKPKYREKIDDLMIENLLKEHFPYIDFEKLKQSINDDE